MAGIEFSVSLKKISEESAFSHLFILYIWKPYNI